MKKLIVLFAILAMVNVASAGVVDIVISSLNGLPINPVSEITIAPTDTINVDVIYTPGPGETIWALSKEVVITGPMTASDATSTPGAPGIITWAPGWNPDLSRVTMLPNGNPLIDTVANDVGLVAPGIVLDHFLFHCEAIGDVTIVLVENPNTGAGGSYELDSEGTPMELLSGPGIIIHQIPEPMTLTLLGLGSLFLARRKK